MPRYYVTFSTSGWVGFDVEADSPEQALALARHGDDGEIVTYSDGEHLNVFDGEVELDGRTLLTEREGKQVPPSLHAPAYYESAD